MFFLGPWKRGQGCCKLLRNSGRNILNDYAWLHGRGGGINLVKSWLYSFCFDNPITRNWKYLPDQTLYNCLGSWSYAIPWIIKWIKEIVQKLSNENVYFFGKVQVKFRIFSEKLQNNFILKLCYPYKTNIIVLGSSI